jgi:alpha-methylacyl-CoA racemase
MNSQASLSSLPGGPLAGLRVLEFAGLGPAPFACMMLSDMGADVVTVDRAGQPLGDPTRLIGRGRRVVHADLKSEQDRSEVQRLAQQADVLVEGFRPGVMERLGLGPQALMAVHPGLIYARMTGWGQTGPLSSTAGHDLNYIALSGALHAVGPRGQAPVPPLNLVGDYGGGSLYLVTGILAALHERQRSGQGQVVDAAITDGVASLMTLMVSQAQRGQWMEQRGHNLLDGGSPFYSVYETADAQHVALGAIEPQFFAIACERLGLDPAWRYAHGEPERWDALRAELRRVFATRTQQAWQEHFAGTDACVTSVLSMSQAMQDPHLQARKTYIDVQGVSHPAPAPRFSRTPSAIQGPPPTHAIPVATILSEWLRCG